MDAAVGVYRHILQPLAPLSTLGFQVTVLDVLAAARLCIAMRQLREEQHRRHLAKQGSKSIEDTSFVRSLAATLLVVYGGEAITGTWSRC